MTTSKLLIALGLTLALGTLPSCKSKDTPIPTPTPKPAPTPTPAPTPEPPAKGMKIENGVLIAFGADATPADGVVRLDKDKVHTIGEKAFAGNTRLKEIHAPGVTKIEAGAFKGCSSLMKVDFGAGQRPPLAIDELNKSTYTAEDAFWGTPEEKVLTFNPKADPNYLAYFEYIARHHFARLDGIEIPASLSASDYVVKNGVLEQVKNNNALTGRGHNGVLILPSSIKKIGNGAFGDRFQNFKAIYGEGIEEIEDNAFVACYSLQFVHFPKLKSIGEQVFSFNGKLDALNFPYLEKIGHLAFNSYGAVNPIRLTYLSLPRVKTIGRGVLEGKYDPARHFTLILGAKPQIDFTPYKDDMPQDGSVTFHGMISPTLYLSPADKAGYDLKDGKWHGFTVKELK